MASPWPVPLSAIERAFADLKTPTVRCLSMMTPAPEYPITAYSLNFARTSFIVRTGSLTFMTTQTLRMWEGLSRTSFSTPSWWMLAVSVPLLISEKTGRMIT
jgi:hypothetical protein